MRDAHPSGGVHEPVVVLLSAVPTGAPHPASRGARLSPGRGPRDRPLEASIRAVAALTGADRSVTLEDGPPHGGSPTSEGSFHKAKALIGHLQQDRGLPARLAAENRQLRVRIGELEALVTRLMEENDRLAVASAAAALDIDSEHLEMQPA